MVLLFALNMCVGAYAQSSSSSSSSSSSNDISNRIKELEQKIAEKQQEKNTLSSQIQTMDNQIALTTFKIQETEQKITQTQKEIELLDAKINGLDESLTRLSKSLMQRVVKGYKNQRVNLLSMIFSANNASEMVNRLKYHKTVQDTNQRLLTQVQNTKINFEEQKVSREKKKEQLAQLKNTYDAQKVELTFQQNAKKRLLEVTKNDEATYQRLLEQAKREQAGFKSFVSSAGSGGPIGANAFGRGKEGWYLSQRDERWAGRRIGSSDMSLLEVGCLITDVAMVYNKYGDSRTPADIASEVDRFFSSTALMLIPWRGPGGRTYTPIAISQIESELSGGNPVIVGVYAGSYGTHYVTLVKKEGNDFIMYDPYYGPDLVFTSKYGMGSIFSAVIFR